MAPAVGLTPSLPSRFGLIYALAAFLPSLIILLAGSFLTLDRTRSVENQNEEEDKYGPIYYKVRKPRKKKPVVRIWRFDGGVGGLLMGFLFGLHFASLLALVIANRTSATPLSSGAFLAIWMIFSLLFAIGGSRWNAVALVLTTILGGASVTIFLATAFHPSLVARLVLLGLLLIIGLLGTFLPILTDRDLRRWTLRAAGACAGSLGVLVGISTFTGVPGWGSAWLRLVVKDDDHAWGTSKEKGLAVVFVLFALIGSASDWYLARRYGADPAQEWDSYLASLPSWNAQAEGIFQPPRTLWQRIFRKKTRGVDHPSLSRIENLPMKEVSDDDETTQEPVKYQDPRPSLQAQTRTIPLPPRLSTAFRSQAQPLPKDEDPSKRPLVLPPQVTEVDEPRRPLLPLSCPTPPRSISSGTTVIGSSFQEVPGSDKQDVEVVDISDEGVELPSRERPPVPKRRSPPASLSHSFASSSREVHSIPEEPEDDGALQIRQTNDSSYIESETLRSPPRGRASTPPPPDYPPTPSLIRAFDRIQRARADAHARGVQLTAETSRLTPRTTRPSIPGVTPPPRDDAGGGLFNEEEWETFWKDVRVKAATVMRQ